MSWSKSARICVCSERAHSGPLKVLQSSAGKLEKQCHSLEAQIEYFSDWSCSNSNWSLWLPVWDYKGWETLWVWEWVTGTQRGVHCWWDMLINHSWTMKPTETKLLLALPPPACSEPADALHSSTASPHHTELMSARSSLHQFLSFPSLVLTPPWSRLLPTCLPSSSFVTRDTHRVNDIWGTKNTEMKKAQSCTRKCKQPKRERTGNKSI